MEEAKLISRILKGYVDVSNSKDLILSEDKKSIDVDLIVYVTNDDFKYSEDHFVIEVGDFKGIVLCYHDGTANPDSTALNTPANRSMNIKKEIVDNSFVNWNDGDAVRIMLLNEVNRTEFYKTINYFELYLKFFGIDEVSEKGFILFNILWNSMCEEGEEVSFDGPKDVFPIIEFITGPRFTKDGGVLTLKLRN